MNLRNSLTIARRELNDSLRDWRIIVPIALLTIGFPWIMLAVSQFVFNYARSFDQEALFITVIPFSMMIVGFFPISFCLVVALEAFVGEKERSTLEPLLAMPISDLELYIGKLLPSIILPLGASYLGMILFDLAFKWDRQLDIPATLTIQIVLLTTLEATLMAASAVVVSSHTTTIRAANLLASFIIIPMTLLVQVESILLLNNHGEILWHIMAGLIVANLIVVRMGMKIFNREEILAREMDELNPASLVRLFWGFVTEGRGRFSLFRFYRQDFFALLSRNRASLAVVFLVMAAGLALGWGYALIYQLPPRALDLEQLTGGSLRENLQNAPTMGILPAFNTRAIFLNNVRSLSAAGLLGLFSFGSLALILLLIPMAMIGFFAGQIWLVGQSPLQFLVAFILPHGILELPAAVLATALALQMGASLISPRANMTAGQSLLASLADFLRVFLLIVIPVLLLAAYVEANLTPQIVVWLYSR
ncbi:MAG: stage II sporulation protein M [Chloroflexi bacterium]|nr:stage II sporulation protein M [Chloroflexota bacterium]